MKAQKRPLAPPSIHKFGGAALADGTAIRRAAEVFLAQSGPKVAVVSAMSGVTDALLEISSRALLGGEDEVATIGAALRARHVAAAQVLVSEGPRRREVLASIEAAFDELAAMAKGLAILRELTPRTSDAILSRGERLASMLFSAALAELGAKTQVVDAALLIPTDGRHGNAFPDLAASDRAITQKLGPLLTRGTTPVVPGFLGSAPDGRVVTLGRGGTDLTATVVGRALGASRIVLWKDVPGLLTADPRVVPDARVLPRLDLREAAELAYYGAKVLHPRALIPLSSLPNGSTGSAGSTGSNTEATRTIPPLFIRPFADPSAAGTEIAALAPSRRDRAHPVRALTAMRGQALLTVAGNGMMGVPGVAARTFSALQREGISVALITQASSEHSLGIGIPKGDAERAKAALLEAFREEIARREVDGVEVRRDVATIAVVGLGMPGTLGMAAKVFAALAAAEVNVVAIAQGSSELNLSVVVDEKRADEALRRIHSAFQLGKIGGGHPAPSTRSDVVLLGFGSVGRELARLLGKVKPGDAGSNLRVVAVIDRSGYVFRPEGLDAKTLDQLAANKKKGKALASLAGGWPAAPTDALTAIASHALAHPLLADLTAEDTTLVLRHALLAGFDIALANKVPLSGPRAAAADLTALAPAAGRRFRFEATVGAGLPVMDTYRKLRDSGDRVEKIEGCFSGTIGFVLTEVGHGRPFSEALRDAMARGLTEPDPRSDLSGLDVARKALILGRLLGFPGELSNVDLEPLVKEAAGASAKGPLDTFLERLPSLDAGWKKRVAQAKAQGRVWRYVAHVTRKKISVGLAEVPASSPFAALQGTDNQVVFTTTRYKTNPLVITGPGAGLAVTAAGVFNDLLELAASATSEGSGT